MPLNYSFTYSLLFQGKLESQGKFTDFSKKELQSLNILNEDKVENKKSSAAAEVVEMMNGKNIDQSNLLKTLTTNKVEETRETQELIAKGKMKSSIFLDTFVAGTRISYWFQHFCVFLSLKLYVVDLITGYHSGKCA